MPCKSSGNSACSITRCCRICTIFGTCSIMTGHCSMHAEHVVHDHSVSSLMTAPISGVAVPPSVPSAFVEIGK